MGSISSCSFIYSFILKQGGFRLNRKEVRFDRMTWRDALFSPKQTADEETRTQSRAGARRRVNTGLDYICFFKGIKNEWYAGNNRSPFTYFEGPDECAETNLNVRAIHGACNVMLMIQKKFLYD